MNRPTTTRKSNRRGTVGAKLVYLRKGHVLLGHIQRYRALNGKRYFAFDRRGVLLNACPVTEQEAKRFLVTRYLRGHNA